MNLIFRKFSLMYTKSLSPQNLTHLDRVLNKNKCDTTRVVLTLCMLDDFAWSFSVFTVAPTKSDSDVIFCLQLLSKTLTCTPLDLTRIDGSLVY